MVILPMTVVKRFHDCLLPTHDAVLKEYESKKNFAVIDGFLTKASGYQFYNTSKFTFDSLVADPENIEINFKDYLAGFSANVQDVLAKFDFENIIKRMVESNTLYLVIKSLILGKAISDRTRLVLWIAVIYLRILLRDFTSLLEKKQELTSQVEMLFTL